MFTRTRGLLPLVLLLCMTGSFGCSQANGGTPNKATTEQAQGAGRMAQGTEKPPPQPPPPSTPATAPAPAEATKEKTPPQGAGLSDPQPSPNSGESGTEPSPAETAQENGASEPVIYYKTINRVEAVPCEEVLKLGPESFMTRYTPSLESRTYRLRIHGALAERYQKCRTDTYRELLGKLSREERLWADSLRNNVTDYINTLNNLRSVCSPREGWPYDHRKVLARMHLEDVLADAMPLLFSPEAQQAPRCGEEDFAPLRQKASALIAQPCLPPKNADEEDRLLHERTRSNDRGGFSSSVDDLKGVCEHFPRPGMQKVFGFALKLLDER